MIGITILLIVVATNLCDMIDVFFMY
jgi:hypothetical protein